MSVSESVVKCRVRQKVPFINNQALVGSVIPLGIALIPYIFMCVKLKFPFIMYFLYILILALLVLNRAGRVRAFDTFVYFQSGSVYVRIPVFVDAFTKRTLYREIFVVDNELNECAYQLSDRSLYLYGKVHVEDKFPDDGRRKVLNSKAEVLTIDEVKSLNEILKNVKAFIPQARVSVLYDEKADAGTQGGRNERR